MVYFLKFGASWILPPGIFILALAGLALEDITINASGLNYILPGWYSGGDYAKFLFPVHGLCSGLYDGLAGIFL